MKAISKEFIFLMSMLFFSLSSNKLAAQANQDSLPGWFKNFTHYPIKSIMVTGGFYTCFGSKYWEINYMDTKDNLLTTTHYTTHNNGRERKFVFKNEINPKNILTALSSTKAGLSHLPQLKEFGLENKTTQKALDSVFTINEGFISTNSFGLTIALVNTNNDTIWFSNSYYETATPYRLPWNIGQYGGNNYFSSYNLNFSKLIKYCLPATFEERLVFNDEYLKKRLRIQ